MTEAGSVCIVGDSEDDLPEAMRGSYGKPVEGVDIRIVDPETGRDGPEGELWLRGPNVMQGYYGRERHDTFDEEGWYHSGDMFTIDAQGYCYFKGRTGDIIRTNGAQVSPREVEGVLSDVTGGRTAIVVGVPDPARGQAVTAILVGSEPVDEAATDRRDATAAFGLQGAAPLPDHGGKRIADTVERQDRPQETGGDSQWPVRRLLRCWRKMLQRAAKMLQWSIRSIR
jgi:acyl-CoA synthetase (AMP-forming)/AMP-acid ligase II